MVICNFTAEQFSEQHAQWDMMRKMVDAGVLFSHPVTPSSTVGTGGTVPRRRFQRGSMQEKSGRRYGVYWRDVLQDDGTFKRLPRWEPLGLVGEQSERTAWKQFKPYLDAENANAMKAAPRTGITLAEFIEEWRVSVGANLKGSTRKSMESHLRAHIVPKLGGLTLTEINTRIVQSFVSYLATGGRSRRFVGNVLLTLSSLQRVAKDWSYACAGFKFSALTLPPEGVRKEARCYTDDEVRRMIAAAPEPLRTTLIIMAVLGLRIGEALALRVCDLDFAKRIIRIRQSVDSATRTVCGVKSKASSADLPMSEELATALSDHLSTRHDGKHELLFVTRTGRPLSAHRLLERYLHPLQDRLNIPRGGFHGMRHAMASALFAEGASPAVVQRQLRHANARITLGIYGHVVGDQQREAVQNRSTRLVN